MRIVLLGKRKYGFVTGACTKELYREEWHEQWEAFNAIVLSWLMNMVAEELLGGIVYATNAQKVWEDLKEQFDKVNCVRIYKLHKEITTLSQVYALWRVPELLPAFVLKGGEVSRFMLGGADLMFPGISIPFEGFPSFSSGEPWAVKVPGNPAAIAVGTTTTSSSEALKAGLRGKALKICHYYRDTLWESAENCHVPNAGFLEDVVFEDPALSLSSRASDSSEVGPSVDRGNVTSNEDMGEMVDVEAASLGVGHPSTTQSDGADEITAQLTNDLSELKVAETSVDESNTEGQHSLSVEEVDALLNKCLLQALHTTLEEKDLPIPGSTFWSSHVLPCRPPGITLDIKKSSHKKLSKWLQAKSSGGLVAFYNLHERWNSIFFPKIVD